MPACKSVGRNLNRVLPNFICLLTEDSYPPDRCNLFHWNPLASIKSFLRTRLPCATLLHFRLPYPSHRCPSNPLFADQWCALESRLTCHSRRHQHQPVVCRVKTLATHHHSGRWAVQPVTRHLREYLPSVTRHFRKYLPSRGQPHPLQFQVQRDTHHHGLPQCPLLQQPLRRRFQALLPARGTDTLLFDAGWGALTAIIKIGQNTASRRK